MPCSAPSFSCNAEESWELARLLYRVCSRLEVPIASWIAEIAGNDYPTAERANELAQLLCELCSNMTHEQSEEIIYARTKSARRLANWWEDHQEYDRKKG